jgi:hypothetical protein
MYSACTKGILNMAPQAQLDRDMGTERKGQVGHTYWRVAMRYNVHSMLHTACYSLWHCALLVATCYFLFAADVAVITAAATASAAAAVVGSCHP